MPALKKSARVLFFGSVAVLSLLQSTLRAQDEPTVERGDGRSAQTGIYPLPVLFYTPETGAAVGAAALYLFRDSLAFRASSITADVIYTQKKQFIAEVDGDMYFAAGLYRLTTDLLFQKYPDKFFSIGNSASESSEESFTPQIARFKAVLYRNISSQVNIGPVVRFENVTMREVTPGGLLSAGNIPGNHGGTSAGIGIVANWDSRDNTFATQSGGFYQVETLFYRSAFGSNFSYDDIEIDLRNSFTLFSDHVLALQGLGEFVHGSAPFQSYAKFGGQNLLRGYFDGRYRDKNMVALQAEYRIPVWWRFGLVGFAGVAQVADRIGGFGMNRFWFAGGGGLRFGWNPDERINIRLDYGAGTNSSGLYITITEAF